MIYVFKLGNPAVMLAQHFGQGGFASPDIACYRYVFWFLSFCHGNENTKLE
jgi:hypothetical protein